jgi:hypothetical protein
MREEIIISAALLGQRIRSTPGRLLRVIAVSYRFGVECCVGELSTDMRIAGRNRVAKIRMRDIERRKEGGKLEMTAKISAVRPALVCWSLHFLNDNKYAVFLFSIQDCRVWEAFADRGSARGVLRMH